MINYLMYHEDPLFKYVLVSFGSGLLLIVFLLLCGKKEKKEEAPTVQTINVNGYPVSSACENVTVDVEEPIVAVQVAEVQSTPQGPFVRQLSSSSSPTLPTETDKSQPNVVQPPAPDSVNPAEATTDDLEIPSNEKTSPYARVQTNAEMLLPKYEYSGNSENSGNSLYAKVQDVAREETAYAVVDIKDKDYDFVNGVLVRRKTVDRDKENTAAAPGMDLYDTPVSPPLLKLPDEEIENSGASGIYEIVPECESKLVKMKNDFEDVGSSDIYDSCGPGGFEGLSSTPPAAPPRDSPPHDSNNILSAESTVVRHGSSKEKLDGKSHKSDKNEKHEHDEKQKGGLFKLFGHSRKQKKTDEHQPSMDMTTPEPCHVAAVDITVDHVGSGQSNTGDDGAPPPLPSVDKLMHISAHRKQHSQSDINPSPDATASGDSSPSGSPSNPDQVIGHPFSCHERPYSNDNRNQAQQLQLSVSVAPTFRGKSNEDERATLEPITKVTSSPQPSTPSDTAKDIKYPASTGQISVHDMDTSSLLSEPDYAEITSSESVVRVKESSFDLLPGYTFIEYGNPDDKRNFSRTDDHDEGNAVTVVNGEVEDAPTYHISCHKTQSKMNDEDDDYADYDEVVPARINSETRFGARNSRKSDQCTTDLDNEMISGVNRSEGFTGSNIPNNVLSGQECSPGLGSPVAADTDIDLSMDSDYAAIDFSARDEERRIKNLYAAIDFSSKKPRDESFNLEEEVDTVPGVMYEGTYNIIPESERIPTTGCSLHDDSIEANPLYEEVPTQMQK